MRRHWLTIAVILTVAQGCDNVSFGGVDVHLQGPPPRDSVALPAPGAEEGQVDAEAPPLPAEPLLLAGVRDGDRATLTLVGRVIGDAVAAFPALSDPPELRARIVAELLGPGTEFILFAHGVRVGRLVVDSTGPAGAYCGRPPAVSGPVELIPAAANADRFMALPAGTASDRPYQPFRSLGHTYDQRVASLRLAGEAIAQVGAVWPPSVLETRADIQAFQFPEQDRPAIAATFLYRDRLRVEEAPESAYSLFLVGEDAGSGDYRSTYLWYRPVGRDGKGAPRLFDHLDLDGDGTSEVLLEVFGAEGRWFAGLARRGRSWTTAFDPGCAAGTG